MDDEILKVIKMALEIEEDEIDYYRKAALKTKDPNGRKVFEYLAEEEEKHEEALKKQLAIVENKGSWLSDEKLFNKKVCKIARTHPKHVVPSKPKADTSDLEALEQSIKIEKKSIDLYTDIACRSSNEKVLKVMHYLIEAEREHLKEVEIQYAFLKSEGIWYDNEISPT